MERLHKIIQHINNDFVENYYISILKRIENCNNQWLKDFYKNKLETLQWISYNDCEDKKLDDYFTAFL